MPELLKLLEKLYEGNFKCFEDCGVYLFDENEDNFVSKVVSECDDKLITKGHPNWDNIEILRSEGYSVYPGEKDSFGWLTGCIRKIGDKRILVFG